LIAVRPPPWLVAVEDLARAVQRGGVHAPAGEEPVSGDAIAAGHRDGAAARVRGAGGDADRIAVEDRAPDVRRELRRRAERIDAHRETPAGGAVGARDLLDHFERRDDVRPEPAFGFRHADLEEPGMRDLEHEVLRELAL